ncbi:HdeD family acid-resistance protein [Limibaculum sp. M0105]|uniref:HdeD family acid-resistance protein n=1 Tax=Thermohalobaculum xanthum TaxID=2753746 RepID=A0A8J7M547_9RHOB|nr:HdeD family acid-resistance protein [Thermohalobaculum xanthum]MBK0397912.1 HdeD family acid-resistance protein [Thermohalobaculum xanthum]
MDNMLKIEEMPEALRRNSVWLLVLGGVLVVGGTCAVLSPFVASVFVLSIIGVVFLFAGVAQIVQAFGAQGWKGGTLHVLAGVLYTVGGLLVLFKPLAGLMAVTLVVVATFLAGGVVRLVAGWQLRPEDGWGWIVLSGLASTLAGVVIWANFPASAVVVLGLIAGFSFIMEGWGMIVLGLAARRLGGMAGGKGEPQS